LSPDLAIDRLLLDEFCTCIDTKPINYSLRQNRFDYVSRVYDRLYKFEKRDALCYYYPSNVLNPFLGLTTY